MLVSLAFRKRQCGVTTVAVILKRRITALWHCASPSNRVIPIDTSGGIQNAAIHNADTPIMWYNNNIDTFLFMDKAEERLLHAYLNNDFSNPYRIGLCMYYSLIRSEEQKLLYCVLVLSVKIA
jgi:hypothetical protein